MPEETRTIVIRLLYTGSNMQKRHLRSWFVDADKQWRLVHRLTSYVYVQFRHQMVVQSRKVTCLGGETRLVFADPDL